MNTKAQLNLSLECTCPECGEELELLDGKPHFNSVDKLYLEPNGWPVTCEKCEAEFLIDVDF